MNISNAELELIKIVLESALSYFEDKSGNDFYLQGEDTTERFDVFKEIIENQADEIDKEELLENLTCWTYDTWVVHYLIELPVQIELNHTQLEMCLLLLEEILQTPSLLGGDFRFEASEIELVKAILKSNDINMNNGIYYINDLKVVDYLINRIKNIL